MFLRPAKKHKSKKRTHEEAIAASDKEDVIKHGIYYEFKIHKKFVSFTANFC